MLRLNSEKEECPCISIRSGETDVIHRDAGDRVRAFLPKRVIFESIGREWHDHSLIVDRGGVDVQVDERGYLLVMPSGGEMAAVDGYNLVAIMVGSVVAGEATHLEEGIAYRSSLFFRGTCVRPFT